jgi:hypothetical protein
MLAESSVRGIADIRDSRPLLQGISGAGRQL